MNDSLDGKSKQLFCQNRHMMLISDEAHSKLRFAPAQCVLLMLLFDSLKKRNYSMIYLLIYLRKISYFSNLLINNLLLFHTI